MQKKGFTLIEMSVTFSLIAVITILLFQLIISLREVYIKGDLQTTMLTKQGILTKKINDDLNNLHLKSITSCGAFCITFHYQTGASYNLSLNIETNSIRYHDYTWKLPEGSKIGTVTTSNYNDSAVVDISLYDSILKIEIPVSHKLLEHDYGLSFIYQYHTSVVSIPNSIPKPSNITNEQHQQNQMSCATL